MTRQPVANLQHPQAAALLSRRGWLAHATQGFAGIALAGLLEREGLLAEEANRSGVVEVLHHPPRAKRVVQLFMGAAQGAWGSRDLAPALLACVRVCVVLA